MAEPLQALASLVLLVTVHKVSSTPAPIRQMTAQCICPDVYIPICCGGKVYSNSCDAKCEGLITTDCVPGECNSIIDLLHTASTVTIPTTTTTTTSAVQRASTSVQQNCGGFKHCSSYYDGCNQCTCTDSGFPICTMRHCPAPPVMDVSASYCTSCRFPYELDKDTNQCVGEPLPPSIPETPCVCTMDIDPVCCDGKEYQNGCRAACSGHNVADCIAGSCQIAMGHSDAVYTAIATEEVIEPAHDMELPGCGGIAYCRSYKKDECNYCGCSNPSVGMNEYGRCTMMECAVLETNECTECMDGYTLDGNGQCTPFCGGFEHCSSFNDGCNDCVCDRTQFVEGCTMKLCFEEETPKCTQCEAGYLWNEVTRECEGCHCITIADPVCCDGVSYGNQCVAGCSGVTAECQSGMCPQKKISCRSPTQCDREHGFKCRVNPECRLSGRSNLECRTDRVCMKLGGECDHNSDCAPDFECLDRNPQRKLCMRYQVE